jgi:hypothetical protein
LQNANQRLQIKTIMAKNKKWLLLEITQRLRVYFTKIIEKNQFLRHNVRYEYPTRNHPNNKYSSTE